MPRDAMGNVIPGSYGPQAMGIKPMNPSPRAQQMLRGTARALTAPGAQMRNPMATQALQRANAGVVRPPLRQGAAALAPDRAAQIQAQQAASAQMTAARGAAVPDPRQAQMADMARMQAARAGAQPVDPRQAQLQQRQADLMRQRQATMQRPRGLGTVMA